MISRIILLSGPVAVGKTTLLHGLEAQFGVSPVKTVDLIFKRLPKTPNERRALQEAGEKLDRQTKGKWIADELARISATLPANTIVAVDAVRILQQIEAIRQGFGSRVTHIHLVAPKGELAKRYSARADQRHRELKTYEAVRFNQTEQAVSLLEDSADVVIDTKQCTVDDVLVRVTCHLGLFGREYKRLVDVLVGGQYGSEGKGHVISYLSPEYHMLVRVGGPNAGHTVWEVPKPYTFHILPSGSRACSADLVIGPGAVIAVDTLLREISDCKITVDRLSIDPQAMVISKRDIKYEEKRLRDTIASTAQGTGAAAARRILDRDAPPLLAKDYKDLRPYIRNTQDILDRAYSENKKILVEGTQGTGLSLYHGEYPHVTSRDTCVAGCLSEVGISPSRVRKVVMVCRTYPIRVQNPSNEGRTSGNMATEIDWRTISKRSKIKLAEIRRCERTSTTNRERRVAEFDWKLLRKAASLNAPTDIALTFVDYFSIKNRDARRFEQLTPETIRFIEEVERVAAAPVTIISTRFHSRSIIDRRSW